MYYTQIGTKLTSLAFSSVVSIGIVSISLLFLAIVANWLSSILSKSKAKSLSELRVYMKKDSSSEASPVTEIEVDSISSALKEEEDISEEVGTEEKNEE